MKRAITCAIICVSLTALYAKFVLWLFTPELEYTCGGGDGYAGQPHVPCDMEKLKAQRIAEFKTWARGFAEERNIDICGINKECK